MAVLHAILVLTFVNRTINPDFFSLSVLKVELPLSFVLGSVYVNVESKTTCLVIFPLALIDITVSMNELALSMGHVILPLAIVFSSIWPALMALAVPDLPLPLSCEYCSVLKLESWPSFRGHISYRAHMLVIEVMSSTSRVVKSMLSCGCHSFLQRLSQIFIWSILVSSYRKTTADHPIAVYNDPLVLNSVLFKVFSATARIATGVTHLI
jgi:hypothetical protein